MSKKIGVQWTPYEANILQGLKVEHIIKTEGLENSIIGSKLTAVLLDRANKLIPKGN